MGPPLVKQVRLVVNSAARGHGSLFGPVELTKDFCSYQLETGLRYRQLDVVKTVLSKLSEDQLESACQLLLKTLRANTPTNSFSDFAQQLLHL